mgnify:CR=1 FL=1
MIIKAYEHQKIKKLKNNLYLFYGENDGYKNQVIKDVFADTYKNNIERFDESEILNNFESFISSLINKSFFDESKLILVSRVSEKITKLVDEILERKKISCNPSSGIETYLRTYRYLHTLIFLHTFTRHTETYIHTYYIGINFHKHVPTNKLI